MVTVLIAGVCSGQRAGSSSVSGVASGQRMRRAHDSRRRHPELRQHCKGASLGGLDCDVRVLICWHYGSTR